MLKSLASPMASIVIMDESCSNAYLESSQRRTGGFLVTGTRPVMSPLSFPEPSIVTVFLVLAFNPTTCLGIVLGSLENSQSFLAAFSWQTGWPNWSP